MQMDYIRKNQIAYKPRAPWLAGFPIILFNLHRRFNSL